MKQINVSGLLFFKAFRFKSLWKHIVLFLLILTPLIWILGFFKLPLVDQYPGQIRLQPDLILHSSDRAGIVSNIHTSKGKTVLANETLITLRSITTPNEISLNNSLRSIDNNIQSVKLSINVLKQQKETAQTKASNQTIKINEEITRINAELDAMKPELALLVTRVERFRALYSKGAASKHELETHEINLHSFERDIASKQTSLNTLEADLLIIEDELFQQFEEFDARIAQEHGEIDKLNQQRKTLLASEVWTIGAQRTGIVTAINITESEQVAPGQRLIDIVGPNQFLEIDFFQSVKKKTNLSLGSEIKVAIDAYPTEIHGLFDAEISIVGKSPTNDGVTFKHTAVFTPETLSILPIVQDGYSVMVSVLVDELTIYQWLLAPYLTKKY